MAKIPFEILLATTLALVLGDTKAQQGEQGDQTFLLGADYDPTSDRGDGGFQDSHWTSQARGVDDGSNYDNVARRNNRRNRWVAGQSNCTCARELTALKRDLREEMRQRVTLKTILDGFISELDGLSIAVAALNKTRQNTDDILTSSRGTGGQPVTFSAKLSYNRELKPLDTIVFDAVIANVGHGYDADTGKFTAPRDGTYLFHSTILSGYNTKVETAIIMNDKEVARIYSGAHDAHGSGSNSVALSLRRGDIVWVRLLYQGGNHVHGYYSTFTGTFLGEA